MTFIVIDEDDKRPPYEQIVSSIMGMVADGQLAPGDRLAPIRQLAGDLGIAPNTVARAYRELELGGFVVSRGRRGTVVAESVGTPAAAGVVDQLRSAVDAARRAGLSPREVVEIVAGHVPR